jgi:hypothetical protein
MGKQEKGARRRDSCEKHARGRQKGAHGIRPDQGSQCGPAMVIGRGKEEGKERGRERW